MNKKVVAGIVVVLLLVGGFFGLKWMYNNYHLPPVVETFCEALGFIEDQYDRSAEPSLKIRTPKKPAVSSSGLVTVEYSVTGYGSAMITMMNAQMGTEQHTKILPWSTSFKAQHGTILSLVAQKQGDDSRAMTVEIKVSGKTVRTSKSSAPYGVATVSAIVE